MRKGVFWGIFIIIVIIIIIIIIIISSKNVKTYYQKNRCDTK